MTRNERLGRQDLTMYLLEPRVLFSFGWKLALKSIVIFNGCFQYLIEFKQVRLLEQLVHQMKTQLCERSNHFERKLDDFVE